jgi:hypothetical protein
MVVQMANAQKSAKKPAKRLEIRTAKKALAANKLSLHNLE